jgi:hypothetical protein
MKFQIMFVVVAAGVALSSAVAHANTDSGLPNNHEGGGNVLAFSEPVGQDANQVVKTGTKGVTPVVFNSALNYGWRYRIHNGEWWYWMPANYWMYYRGGRWIPYDAVVYRRPVIVNRGPYYYRDGYRYGNYWGPGYSYYRPGYRYWDGYRYRPGYSYYRGPGYGYFGPYRYGYGQYAYRNPYYIRDPGVRAGANVGGAIGGAIGGRGGADVGARIGAGVGRARR